MALPWKELVITCAFIGSTAVLLSCLVPMQKKRDLLELDKLKIKNVSNTFIEENLKCVFCNIVKEQNNDIESGVNRIVYRTDRLIAFPDISPQGKEHYLVTYPLYLYTL